MGQGRLYEGKGLRERAGFPQVEPGRVTQMRKQPEPWGEAGRVSCRQMVKGTGGWVEECT